MATLNVKNLDDALYERLKRRAAANHRSVAQEVTHILAAATAERPATSLMALDGLGRSLWEGGDAADRVANERDGWT